VGRLYRLRPAFAAPERRFHLDHYESAQVGMIFATTSLTREAAARQSLSDRLGAVAATRDAVPGHIV
jgi:hypothetical protein